MLVQVPFLHAHTRRLPLIRCANGESASVMQATLVRLSCRFVSNAVMAITSHYTTTHGMTWMAVSAALIYQCELCGMAALAVFWL